MPRHKCPATSDAALVSRQRPQAAAVLHDGLAVRLGLGLRTVRLGHGRAVIADFQQAGKDRRAKQHGSLRHAGTRPHDLLDHVRVHVCERALERCGVPGLMPHQQALVEGMDGALLPAIAVLARLVKPGEPELNGIVKGLQEPAFRTYCAGVHKITARWLESATPGHACKSRSSERWMTVYETPSATRPITSESPASPSSICLPFG